ncbi:MAG TPA: hypothetical protein VKB75_01175 [Jatrophihabitans sp.]|nr:hypothetical protein [Jatrophihabitans sp.]
MAVGYHVGTDGLLRGLVERWNGVSWTILPAPTPGIKTNTFDNVSCVSATACVLVGTSDRFATGLFSERWDGSGWHVSTMPRGKGINTLSCAAVNFCMALGTITINGSSQAAAWRWNGSAWTRSTAPTLRKTDLQSVSCPTSRSCFAVGSVRTSGFNSAPRIEHWDGTAWSIRPLKVPSGSALSSVACPRPRFCTAVGDTTNKSGSSRMLVLDRSGTPAWNVSSPVFPKGVFDASLRHVSCSAIRVCTATAIYNRTPDSGQNVSVATRGARGGFHLSTKPINAGLQSVSCRPVACTVVGFSPAPDPHVSNGAVQGSSPFAARGLIDGHAAVPAGTADGMLTSVSCVASGFCAATTNVSLADAPAIDTRTGGKWVRASDSGTTPLEDVSCTSDTFCMAVGFFSSQRWDGLSWAAVTIPAPDGAREDPLYSVSCTSSTSCIAVGATKLSGGGQPLAESWNGATWTTLPTPTLPNSSNALLESVSCPAVTTCIASGWFFSSATHTARPLIESWDGLSWKIVPAAPSQSNVDVQLHHVSCSSATSCMVIVSPRGGHYRVEQWDGHNWTLMDVTRPGTDFIELSDVSCTSATSCTLVGADDSTRGGLVENWDGTHWTVTPSAADPYGDQLQLTGVSCTDATSCTAVGSTHRQLFLPFAEARN